MVGTHTLWLTACYSSGEGGVQQQPVRFSTTYYLRTNIDLDRTASIEAQLWSDDTYGCGEWSTGNLLGRIVWRHADKVHKWRYILNWIIIIKWVGECAKVQSNALFPHSHSTKGQSDTSGDMRGTKNSLHVYFPRSIISLTYKLRPATEKWRTQYHFLLNLRIHVIHPLFY